MNVVTFRRGAESERWHPDDDVAEVMIDGESLIQLADRCTGGAVGGRWLKAEWVLSPGHRVWLGEPPLGPDGPDDLVDGERVAVTRCVDGLLGCGGVLMRVEVTQDEVVWSDFRDAATKKPIDLGPFRFDRRGLESALAAVAKPG